MCDVLRYRAEKKAMNGSVYDCDSYLALRCKRHSVKFTNRSEAAGGTIDGEKYFHNELRFCVQDSRLTIRFTDE